MISVLLPYELVRFIFELAASENHHTAFTLILVSHASRNWIERQLYKRVHLLCQADRVTFERCRIARDDDAFIANTVKQLYATPNATLLSVCTKITHLSIQSYTDEDYPTIIFLPHLENLKYLALGFSSIVSWDAPPPNITHLQLYHNSFQVPPFAHARPTLSHIMIDWTISDYHNPVANYLSLLLDGLPPQHLHIVVTLHDNMFLLTQDEISLLQERYPRLFFVDRRSRSPLKNMMKCDASLISRFEFWDEMEEFLAGTRV